VRFLMIFLDRLMISNDFISEYMMGGMDLPHLFF
jgi:hypothetical protein